MRDYGLDEDESDDDFNRWISEGYFEKLDALPRKLFSTIDDESSRPKPLSIKKPKYDEYGNEIEDDGYRNPGGGSGRPLSTNRSSKSISIRATPEQHRKFLALGGCKWIKKVIDEAAQ